MPTIETDDGVPLFYADAGSGDPVVFVHGLFLDHQVFERTIHDLSTDYRVVAPDLRGHGRSGKPPGPYAVDRMVTDLEYLIRALDLTGVRFVGWSLGAAFGALLATRTDAVDRWVLVTTTLFAMLAGEDHGGSDALDLDALVDDLRASRPNALRSFAEGLFHQEVGRPTVDWYWDLCMQSSFAMGVTLPRSFADIDVDELRTDLADVSEPVAVFQGAHDGAATPEAARYVAEELVPNGDFVAFEESAHVPFVEQPDRFDAALRRHLDG